MFTHASYTTGGYPAPGTVVSIPLLIAWRHKGVVTDRWYRGKPTVISGSRRAGKVCEELWDVFADGFSPRDDGYPSDLLAHEVVRRARQLIGTKYKAVNWNCDHVVSVAHGLKAESAQVAATVAITVVALGILAVRQR